MTILLFIIAAIFAYGCYKLKETLAAYAVLGFAGIAVLKVILDILNISNKLF
jgi:hypothetical protein